MRILLVEDNPDIVRSLSALLEREGYAVVTAAGQREALALLDGERPDLALVDISLADGSGYTVCTAALRKLPELPIVFLTASDDEMSVVTGLELGAADYITKPFRPLELLSRVKTALRRRGVAQSVFEIGSLAVDTVRGTCHKDGREVFLSALEYRLLLVFLNHPGQVLSRSKLLEAIWDIAGEFVNDNTLTVYIKRLRDKIEEDPADPKRVVTVRGLGYKLDTEA